MTKLLTCTLITAMAFLVASCQSSSQSSSASTSSPSASSSQEQPSSAAADSSAAPSGEQEGENTPEQQASYEPTSNEPTGSESAGNEGMPSDPSNEDMDEVTSNPTGGAGEEAMSDEEAVSILDGQLDESIAVFDSMIINERVASQSTENDLPEDDGSWGDDEPLFEEADISENSDGQGQTSLPTAGDDEGEGNAASSTARGAGDGSIVSRNGVRGNAANNQAPEDVSDGSDDDIVARQIREAALKEKDPVLREKLWEEYRKYKRGQ
ncbi:MAG: hypothetical protein V7718_03360 [Porticoccus sp.]